MFAVTVAFVLVMLPTLTRDILGAGEVEKVSYTVRAAGKDRSVDASISYSVSGIRTVRVKDAAPEEAVRVSGPTQAVCP